MPQQHTNSYTLSITDFDATAVHSTMCDLIIDMWTAAKAWNYYCNWNKSKFLDFNWGICSNTNPIPNPFQHHRPGHSQVTNNNKHHKKIYSWCSANRAGWAGSPDSTLGCILLYKLVPSTIHIWPTPPQRAVQALTSDTKGSDVSTVLSIIKQTRGMRELW